MTSIYFFTCDLFAVRNFEKVHGEAGRLDGSVSGVSGSDTEYQAKNAGAESLLLQTAPGPISATISSCQLLFPPAASSGWMKHL